VPKYAKIVTIYSVMNKICILGQGYAECF